MKTGLIMEGGAMRGLFTCGIIDVFMENGIVFDGAVGISAGAVFGCNYKSMQIGRPLRYNTTYCNDPRYCSFSSLIKTGDLYGADFCYNQIMHVLDPFDTEAFKNNPMEFYVGATDIESGKCVYHKCYDGREEDTLWFRASASMPLVSRPVEINGHLYLDGGMTDSIPYEFMVSQGYDRNVVILTQPQGFVKKSNKLLPLFRTVNRKYPKIAEVMAVRHLRYNHQVAEVEKDEKRGRAYIIRPAKSLNIGKTEKNPDELRRVYEIGRQTALQQLDAIREFIRKPDKQ